MESSQGDLYIEYSKTVTECMEKIIKSAPRKCDVLKKEAKRAIEMVKEEGDGPYDANKYFYIMKLALDIRDNKMMIYVLNYIQKLISHEFLDGNTKDNCVYDDESKSQSDNGNSKYPRKLIDAIVESISQCVEDGTPDVHLQIIKSLVTIISTMTCKVHDSSLLDAFRACYKIHLSTTNQTNQSVSKVALHQMMTTVFQKMEAYAGNFGVDIQTIQKSLDNKFNRKKTVSRLQKDFGVTEFAVSSFFNDEEDSVEKSSEEPERVGTQINFSAIDQYLYMLCQNMVDNVSIYHERRNILIDKIEEQQNSVSKEESKNGEENIREFEAKLNSLELQIVPKKQMRKVPHIDIKLFNEKGIKCGKFGWCMVCRKEANLYCKDTLYPICSLDCKQRLLTLIDSIEAERTNSFPNYYNNEEMKRHFTDAILLFKSICKLFIKADPNNMSTYSLKSQIMGLELILNVVEKPGPTFLTRPEFINIIKTSLCSGLLKHCVSNEKTVFALSISIFYALFVHFREHLKYEILVLIEQIFLKVLNSGNSNYHHKYLILRVFDKIAKNTKHLLEIFVNYDCDIESKDILERMIETLSKIAQGKFSKTEHSNMITEKEEHSLKLYALKILASIVMRLNQFLTEEQKESKEELKQQNSGGFKNEVEEDEEQSPHISHQNSLSDSSTLIDPKQANYERNRSLKNNIYKAAVKFNLKPKKGVQYYLEFQHSTDVEHQEKVKLILNFLLTTPALDKTAIGDYLGEDEDFNKDVLYALIEAIDFTQKPFVTALKLLLAGFRLPGEGQKVDRIMEKFGEKYVKDNPESFGSSECVYLLAYATMMLQTSIHNPSARQNNFMSMEDFKKMTKGINNGKDLEDKFIEDVYHTIETDPITLVEDDEARLRQEGSNATSYKRKQDLFIKEGQGLAKRGHELMKEKKKTSQFVLVNDSQAIGPLFESCWSAMFAVFSVLLEEHEDENIINLCIDGFLNSIKICGFYGMDTERNAFVGSLANFTGINSTLDTEGLIKRELTDKNVLFIKALISLAMYEGNYLGSSWKNILRVISMINYYHNIGSGSPSFNDFSEPHSSPKVDMEVEAIKKLNAARICQEIDESDIDKIFSNSVSLGSISIIDFISDVCTVSEEELNNHENPRIFMLQKLVEVADINMNRVRVEFSNLWKKIGHHLSSYGQNRNKRIAEYSVDSLRQLAKKFLEKQELANFHFQKDFLEPFRTIMLGSYTNEGLQDIRFFILTCMCQFAQQKIKSIKSGWEIILDIFKLAAGDENEDLYQESLRTMKFILQKQNFEVIEEYFNKIMDCLFKYVENRKFIEEAYPAFELLEIMGDELATNKNLKFPVKSKEKYEEYEREQWKTLLLSLAKRSFDEREGIAEHSHKLLFEILQKHSSRIHENLWEVIFHELLRAIFDDLNVSIETCDPTHENHNRYTKNARDMVIDFVKIIDIMSEEKFKSSIMIFVQIVKNFILTNPESPLGQELLKGVINVIKESGSKFDQELWKTFINVISKLLDETLASSLLEDRKEEMKRDNDTTDTRRSIGSSSSRLSNLCNTQSIQQLLLISSVENISEYYDTLEYKDISILLDKVKNSYDLAHRFNMNIERRVEVLKNGSLRPVNNVLPGLIKQERQSLKIYFFVISKIYKSPKDHLTKSEASEMILTFACKVLKEYSDNYEAIMHSDDGDNDSPSIKESYKYEVLDLKSKNEEINRILVSLSSIFSESIFKTLLSLDKEDMEPHVKELAPILINLTVSDQLPFRLRLRELLNLVWKIGVKE